MDRYIRKPMKAAFRRLRTSTQDQEVSRSLSARLQRFRKQKNHCLGGLVPLSPELLAIRIADHDVAVVSLPARVDYTERKGTPDSCTSGDASQALFADDPARLIEVHDGNKEYLAMTLSKELMGSFNNVMSGAERVSAILSSTADTSISDAVIQGSREHQDSGYGFAKQQAHLRKVYSIDNQLADLQQLLTKLDKRLDFKIVEKSVKIRKDLDQELSRQRARHDAFFRTLMKAMEGTLDLDSFKDERHDVESQRDIVEGPVLAPASSILNATQEHNEFPSPLDQDLLFRNTSVYPIYPQHEGRHCLFCERFGKCEVISTLSDYESILTIDSMETNRSKGSYDSNGFLKSDDEQLVKPSSEGETDHYVQQMGVSDAQSVSLSSRTSALHALNWLTPYNDLTVTIDATDGDIIDIDHEWRSTYFYQDSYHVSRPAVTVPQSDYASMEHRDSDQAPSIRGSEHSRSGTISPLDVQQFLDSTAAALEKIGSSRSRFHLQCSYNAYSGDSDRLPTASTKLAVVDADVAPLLSWQQGVAAFFDNNNVDDDDASSGVTKPAVDHWSSKSVTPSDSASCLAEGFDRRKIDEWRDTCEKIRDEMGYYQ
ncbi:MAG: hypothetical protein M1827_007158 [Pycnora praestabilis]|nr:MAG: hypothetical protein M1827_007158 [Pycnora praestabilis]